jgi:hypothetical protein
MKKWSLLVFLVSSALAAFSSCSSTPKPELASDQPAVTAPAPADSLNLGAASAGRAH